MSYACARPGGAWTAGRGEISSSSPLSKVDTKPQDSLNTKAADLKLNEDHNPKVTTSGCECRTITETNTYEVCGYVEIHWNIGSHWIPVVLRRAEGNIAT